jgi:N-acetylglucosaminyldiphosphoundecaprenol N-acetyl-beta-D-mannosaminyltransferase
MECQHNPSLRPLFNRSGMTTPDGMSVVWLLKLMGHKNVTRVYGPDLMRAVCQRSAETTGYRHFLYGGAPGVTEELADRLQASYPGLKIAGMYSPPFRPLTEAEDQEVIDMINASQADIVWVGISTPKQEIWMAEHLGKVNAPVMVGVGAA